MNYTAFRTAYRHPSLALGKLLGRDEARTNCEHIEFELKKARLRYSKLTEDKLTLDDIIAQFYRKICFFDNHVYPLCRWFKPDVVVETGVEAGASSAFCLQALEDNAKGHLHSIDLPNATYTFKDPDNPGENIRVSNVIRGGGKTGYVVPARLRNRWTLLIGDAKTELPSLLERIGSVDLFHHDSEHTYDFMRFEYDAVWDKLKSGGVLSSDDVNWNLAFRDFCAERQSKPHVVSAMGYTVKGEDVNS